MWKIEELLETIKGKIEARETNEEVMAHKVHRRKQNPVANDSKPIHPIANTLLSMESKGVGIRCVNCSGEHYYKHPVQSFDDRFIIVHRCGISVAREIRIK